jgi:predicted Zn-dependent peptidase
MEDPLFPATRMLARLLDKELAAGVNARLAAAGRTGTVLEAEAGLDTYARLGTLQVRAVLDAAVTWDDAGQALRDEVLDRLSRAPWAGSDLDEIRLEEKASLQRLWEKPHYFGLDRAPYVAGGGWEMARDMARALSWVETADVKDAAKRVASAGRWAVFAAGPEVPPDEGEAAPPAGAAAAPDAAPATPGSRELVARWKEPAAPAGPLPALTQGAPGSGGARGQPVVRTYLPNGLLVILDSSDDSRVFAAHVLARDRALCEPAGKHGVAELLHGMVGTAGARGHAAGDLSTALRRIGGSLKTQDDPAIPYDDIYLSPEYSYIRLEALDEFAGEALDLLRGLLADPALGDERAFASARESLLSRARRAATSPRDRARLALARSLWGEGHPLASSPFGTEAEVSSITQADVRSFHASYFSPKNLIVSIGTSLPPERILPMLEARLGRWSLSGSAPRPVAAMPAPGDVPQGAPAPSPRPVAETLAGPQSYVAWGRLASATDAAGLSAVASVLGARMGDVLREQRGLAYSLGADASPLGGMVQVTAGMGILPEKLDDARAGLREMVLSLVARPPTQEELDAAARDTHVRTLMRGLSRINRGWRRCVDEMRRGSPAAAATGPAPLPADRAAALARALVDPAALTPWVEAVVGRGSAETP